MFAVTQNSNNDLAPDASPNSLPGDYNTPSTTSANTVPEQLIHRSGTSLSGPPTDGQDPRTVKAPNPRACTCKPQQHGCGVVNPPKVPKKKAEEVLYLLITTFVGKKERLQERENVGSCEGVGREDVGAHCREQGGLCDTALNCDELEDDVEVTLLEELFDWSCLTKSNQYGSQKKTFRPCTNQQRKRELVKTLSANQDDVEGKTPTDITQGLSFVRKFLLPVLERDISLHDSMTNDVIASLYKKSEQGVCCHFRKCAMYKKFKHRLILENMLRVHKCGRNQKRFSEMNKLVTLLMPEEEEEEEEEEEKVKVFSDEQVTWHRCFLDDDGFITSFF